MLARELSAILSDVHDGNQIKDCSLIKALADPGCANRPRRNPACAHPTTPDGRADVQEALRGLKAVAR